MNVFMVQKFRLKLVHFACLDFSIFNRPKTNSNFTQFTKGFQTQFRPDKPLQCVGQAAESKFKPLLFIWPSLQKAIPDQQVFYCKWPCNCVSAFVLLRLVGRGRPLACSHLLWDNMLPLLQNCHRLNSRHKKVLMLCKFWGVRAEFCGHCYSQSCHHLLVSELNKA